jgi:hypothetical protein
MNITVFCAIFGGYDRLHPPSNLNSDINYVLFTDKQVSMPPYEVRVVKPPYSRRKTARYYKINATKWFPDSDVIIWHDGWLILKKDPALLIPFLGENDIAMESHIERNCIYKEAEEVIRVRKVVDPKYPRAQMQKYRNEGMPENYGLTSTFMIVRRNTETIRELEELWWHEVDNHSLRDQLSFMYCCWKLGVECSRIPIRQGFYRTQAHAGKY